MTVKERSKKKAKTDCRLYQFAHINDNISVTWYRTRLNGIWILEFNISTSIHFERDNFIRLFASFWYCIYLNGLWTVFFPSSSFSSDQKMFKSWERKAKSLLDLPFINVNKFKKFKFYRKPIKHTLKNHFANINSIIGFFVFICFN